MAVASDEWEDGVRTFEHNRTQFERDQVSHFRESLAAAVAPDASSSTRVRAVLNVRSATSVDRPHVEGMRWWETCSRWSGRDVAVGLEETFGVIRWMRRPRTSGRRAIAMAIYDSHTTNCLLASRPYERVFLIAVACDRTVSSGRVNRLRRQINLFRFPLAR